MEIFEINLQYAYQKRIDELQDLSREYLCTIKKWRELPVRCTQGP